MKHWLVGLALALVAGMAQAQDLPKPAGPVILTVTGMIQKTNGEGRADFDRPMLEALGLVEVATTTAWTKETPKFRGVPLQALLTYLDAKGRTLRATALNDYSVAIPVSDLEKWPVLLALDQDGTALPRRGKGPVWVLYPGIEGNQDAPIYRDRSIWQLRTLDVR